MSWGAETARKFTEAEINEMLAGLDSLRYGQVVRAKGYVASDGEDWIYFDYVPGERELRHGAPAVTGSIASSRPSASSVHKIRFLISDLLSSFGRRSA